MNEQQKKVLFEMIGTSGLEELEAIARLVGNGDKHSNFSDPYSVAIRLLTQGIDNAKTVLTQGIGVGADVLFIVKENQSDLK